ncbi:MAG: hypothetical protein QXY50_06065 [Candidatus Caldarchaeum sp.]
MAGLKKLRDERHVYRDHDFVETVDGWLFGVVSDIHPPGRILSYLKYVPGEGVWSRGGVAYRRVLTSYTTRELAQVLDMVRRARPQYIYHDPMTGEDFTYVPAELVKKHYRCEEKLQQILRSPSTTLEGTCAKLVGKLSARSGVETCFFGVSGSLLLGLHNPAADIDLVVYGGRNFRRVVDAAQHTQTAQHVSEMRKMLVRNFLKKYPLAVDDAERLAARCLTRGFFDGVPFSLHAVRLLEEITSGYGALRYSDAGIRRTTMRVVNASEGVFTPAVYRVEDLGGVGVERLLCYDTTFAGLFMEGDLVEAVGKLEKVQDIAGGVDYYSLLVGSVKTAGVEYVRLLKTA